MDRAISDPGLDIHLDAQGEAQTNLLGVDTLPNPIVKSSLARSSGEVEPGWKATVWKQSNQT